MYFLALYIGSQGVCITKKMGHFYMEILDNSEQFKLNCGHCNAQLCYNFEIISTDYKCKNGKALFVALV